MKGEERVAESCFSFTCCVDEFWKIKRGGGGAIKPHISKISPEQRNVDIASPTHS